VLAHLSAQRTLYEGLLEALENLFELPGVIGAISCSSSSAGTCNCVAFCAVALVFVLVGIHAPCGHVMPHTQGF
jgi:hypothetical protein